ncbi:unnamed protein product [Ilex paraguariensis]
MDESWKMRIGMGMPTNKPNLPRRKSTEETSHRSIFNNSDSLDPEDFNDVFGGPPKTVLCRQFSGGDFSRSSNGSFYEEVFRPTENVAQIKNGRSLPEFRIPASGNNRRSQEFYKDIFRSDGDVRSSMSRSKSTKTSSSSVLSSEELSPLRPVIGENDDVLFSSFASKLRPINVPCRWNSSTMMHVEHPSEQGVPAFPSNCPSYIEKECNENFRNSHFGLSRQVPSPETISLEPYAYGSVKVSIEDFELNSPSSVVSSLCQDQEEKTGIVQDKELQEQCTELEEDEEMSSYVIEINSDHRTGTGEALGVDEAIAWAKEKFQTQSSEKDWNVREDEKEQSVEMEDRPNAQQFSDDQIDSNGSMPSPAMEMEVLDEDIRLWSAGKEANIRLLISTLHHILWPNSGWYPLSLTNLIESSHVKKAYQKARLCLHPDKLQQRGATLPQKYVAEKAFSILQDAWAAFISQDVFFS